MVSVRGWLRAAAIAAVGAAVLMVAAAASGRLRLVPIIAGAFAIGMIAATLGLDRKLRALPVAERPGGEQAALAINGRLLAIVYLWGALAMQGLYLTPLTGLRWQHGWQYVAAMALVAASAWTFARLVVVADPAERRKMVSLALPLAVVHAFGGAMGLMFLVVSGKMSTVRPDWAANQVFFWGATAVTVVAAIGLRVQTRAERD
jgi:hypothetical protein